MRVITQVLFVAATMAAFSGGAAAQVPVPQPDREARERAREERERAREERRRAAEERRARLDEQRGPEHTEQFSRVIRLGRNGTFDLSNIAGEVTVTGGGGDDVRIEATKRVRHRDEAEAKALLQAIGIAVSERTGLVEVRTEMPRRRNWTGGVDYRVAVPNGANVTLRAVSGNLRVSNVRGELRAETVSGNVVAGSVGRVRSLQSVSGNVEITDASAEDLELGTVSGDVIARAVKARSLDLESVSGNMRFADAESERITFKAISGDMDYTGRLPRNARYDLQTHSGNIRLVLDGNPGFDLDASTFSGDVRSDFQLSGAQTADAGDRRRRSRTLRGTTGDASALLTLRSFSGDILITRR